ncbi:amino acid adenylation domain-containing protein [Halobacillus karajensis]|uniref:non-ribosomal peptide synthetase n=1 Tax=Halobacillus karajensis TaxID=195088 RepID=UPI0008A73E6B|nr:non-ribosomal peptide synthetase [Halobacillus karajensis]SEH77093.1 amino acid adenylation domain-containing protein [Halobacillus karajensis]
MLDSSKPNTQLLESRLINRYSGVERTIWDVLLNRDSAHSLTTNSARIEEEVFLPEGLSASIEDITAVAAMLGSFFSPDGRVAIKKHVNGLATCFEIDGNKLRKAGDARSYIDQETQSADQAEVDLSATDIVVTDGEVSPTADSMVCLIVQDERCLLSVRADLFKQSMFAHLRSVTSFACARVLNPKAETSLDILPKHTSSGLHERKSLVERILIHTQNKPNEIAIVDDALGETLTYGELWNASEAIIQQMSKQATIHQSHMRVALFMERGWRYLATIIAVQRIGGTCVLIDSTHPDERIKGLIEETNPDAVITVGNMIERARGLVDYPIIPLRNETNVEKSSNLEFGKKVETNNEVCFIAGTSGTTGSPKAACLSYRGMTSTIDAIIDAAELRENTRGSWLSSPGYGMIEVDPLPVLGAGGTVCIPSSDALQDIRIMTKWFEEKKLSHTLVMTSVAEAIWTSNFNNSLKTMLIAGERCKKWPPSTLNYTVLNVYGSAEAAVVSIEDLSGPRNTILPSVGKAVSGANTYVVDGNGQELPAGCVGELIITGETLSVGYLDSEQTEKAFDKNSFDNTSRLQYVSGDRARIGLDGTVEIFGRTDGLVKIRGHRVDLAEIEITALKVQGVMKAAALCFSENSGETIVLFLEESNDVKDIKNKVSDYLREQLPSAAHPSQINTMVLPLGPNGKVDYKALRDYELEQDTSETIFIPTTRTEQSLNDSWINWTRCDYVTLESNFFHSGGDSLKAMRMIGELTHNYGINIKMVSFLENPVFSNLIRLANESLNANLPVFEHLPADEQLNPFELNESQQALWIGRGSDFNYGGVGCQGYFEWEVEDLVYDRFTSAVGMLVDRHPMLRMTIDSTGRQKIETVNGETAVEYIDLSELSSEKISREIDQIRAQMANDEIGTMQWPLFRFVVSRISPSTSRIHFCIDMLIADAWSIFQVIIPDLIDLYTKKDPQLPQIQTTFNDYVTYRYKVRRSEQYRFDRDYWIQKIKDLPAAPKLPHLEQGETTTPVRFERHEGRLEKGKWNRLKAKAQERMISPSGIVALALCEVLRYWSEENRFTLNFPVSDRMPVSNDIDLVVGDFTNTLLVPYENEDKDTIETRGQRLQDAIWEALDHRLFTGVEVLRELARVKRTGSEPLMPVVLTSLLGHPGRHDVSQLGKEVFGVSQTPQVTLDVQIRESEDTLYYKWDYLTGVIRPDVIEVMFGTFCELLEKFADDSDIWSETWLDLRPPSQKILREKVNSTEEPIPNYHLRDLLLERIEENWNDPAVIDITGEYKWGEIGHAAVQVKTMIKQVCNSSDRFVGILLPKGVAQYEAVYGCLLAGVGYIPIDVDLPLERVQAILSQAGARVVIALPDTRVPSGICRIEHSTERIWNSNKQIKDLNLEPVLEDYSPYVIFTSGSTGEPKGVEVPEVAVVNHISDVIDRFNLDKSTRHLATAALHFDMSVFDVFGPLLHGGSVVIPKSEAGPDPENWLRLHRRHKVTFWACVPAIMELVCFVAETSNEVDPVKTLNNIIMAGDWIPLSLLPRAKAVFPSARMFSCGGPTETTNWSVIHEINEDEGSICRSVIYGSPMRNSKYHILSENWIDCPDWVPGEMLVESDVSLARGYLGKPDITKRSFVYHPRTGRRMYRTGDLGRYLPNGEIEILGRVDNQIKIKGYRIELGEIENVAASCSGVSRACAISLPGPDGKPKHIGLAYIGESDSEEILMELKKHLPNYMVPKVLKRVSTLPLSKNGKVDVRTLRETLKNKNKKELNNGDKNAILRNVIRFISSHLSQPVVLPDDNFIKLGGNSEDAMKLKDEMESQLFVEVSIESIMHSETIDELANELAERVER